MSRERFVVRFVPNPYPYVAAAGPRSVRRRHRLLVATVLPNMLLAVGRTINYPDR